MDELVPDPDERRDMMEMAKADEEQFEQALAEAEAEGDLSRANVVRKVKAILEPERIATCQHCGRTFTPARSDAAYCSARCRQAAYRTRKDADKPKPRRAPLPDGFRNASLDLDRIMRRLDRLVTDDRFRRRRKDLVRYRSDLVRARDQITAMIDRFDAD